MEKAPTETLALLSALPSGTERNRLLECAFIASLQQPLVDDQSSAGWSIYQRLPEESQIANATAYGQAWAKQGNLQDVGAWVQNFR